MPKLSIIVPVYNVESYLAQCLDSIIGQTFQDWEMIIVDDGSTDNSRLVIEEYAKKDQRIKLLFHQENKSLGIARNTGIETARGEFVAFVDSDDWLEPEMYAGMLAEQQATGADIVECNFINETTAGQSLPELTKEPGQFNMSEGEENEYILSLYQRRMSGFVWDKIYRLSIIKKHGLNFINSHKTPSEDLLFNLCLAHHIERIVSIAQPYYHYRHRFGSLSRKKRPNLMEEQIGIINNYISTTTDGDWQKIPPAFFLLVVNQVVYGLLHAVIHEEKPIRAGAACLKRAAKEPVIRHSLKINILSPHIGPKRRLLLLLFSLRSYRLISILFCRILKMDRVADDYRA